MSLKYGPPHTTSGYSVLPDGRVEVVPKVGGSDFEPQDRDTNVAHSRCQLCCDTFKINIAPSQGVTTSAGLCASYEVKVQVLSGTLGIFLPDDKDARND